MKNHLSIIGGGIVGLTTAIAAAKKKDFDQITIFEKDKCGAHNSGRNSGIIHAGIYYKPNTLRAELCVKGSKELRNWCNKKQLTLLEIGKLIIPTNKEEKKELLRLKNNADLNGAETYILKKESDINKICDQVISYQNTAIWSPNTYNCNPKEVIKSIKEECLSEGIEILENTEAKISKRAHKVYSISANDKTYESKIIINVAGQHADILSRQCQNQQKEKFLPVLGKYFRCVEDSSWKLPSTNIYPVPNAKLPFLGLHVSPSWDGKCYAGPTALPILSRESYEGFNSLDFDVFSTIMKFGYKNIISNPKFIFDYLSEELRHLIISEAAKDLKIIFPNFSSQNLVSSKKSGIRPQLINIDNSNNNRII